MTELEVARLVGEIVGAIGVVGAGVAIVVGKISHVLRAVETVQEAIGEKDRPASGTVRAQLKHQDECTDKLREKMDQEIKAASNERLRVAERLARIEGKLNIPAMEED